MASLVFFLMELALSLWVAFANGQTLFYYDTAAYLERGETMLADFGLQKPAPEPVAVAVPPGSGAEAVGAMKDDDSVDGSRSPVYSLVLGLFAHFTALEGVILANALLALMAIWLPARIALRLYAPAIPPWGLTLAAVALSALGSYAFYVAFLMPDILAPVLLLVAATLVAFAGRMTFGELALAMFLAITAVSNHLSHQAIAMLLIPVSLVVSLIVGGRRKLLAPTLIAVVALVGAGEQALFRKAVQTVKKADVVYLPFITARLVQDGVGYDYLETHCPNDAIATCKLWEALQLSDDPYRLTATHIVFETSERLGSFRRLPQDDQRRVAGAQFRFFFDVLRAYPVGTTMAFLKNTLTQARMNSVDMTLPKDTIIAKFDGAPGLAFTEFALGRLAQNRVWLEPVTPAQQTLYLVSLVLVLAGMVWPGMPGRFRAFLAMVLLGILVNAFVCGGVSQPATRYGARVIWLLPAMAVFALAIVRSLPALRQSGYYDITRRTVR